MTRPDTERRGLATCPTCGSPVEVVSSDEGTHYYRPHLDALEGGDDD